MNKSDQLDRLVQSLETLLEQLPNDGDSDIAALRERAAQTIFEVWTAVTTQNSRSPLPGERAFRSVQHAVARRPWSSFGTVLLLAGIVGFLVGGRVLSGTMSGRD